MKQASSFGTVLNTLYWLWFIFEQINAKVDLGPIIVLTAMPAPDRPCRGQTECHKRGALFVQSTFYKGVQTVFWWFLTLVLEELQGQRHEYSIKVPPTHLVGSGCLAHQRVSFCLHSAVSTRLSNNKSGKYICAQRDPAKMTYLGGMDGCKARNMCAS